MEWRIDPNQWDEAIEAADGPQVVVAGPGAGKTEFLVRRALHLIDQREVAPEDLLILSFSRRGAADLRTRVESALNRSFTLVSASTFHSFAYRLLETHGLEVNGWKEMPSLLTGPEQVALVRRLLAADDAARWPAMFRPMLGSHTLAIEVTDFILRAEEQLLSPGDVEERASGRDDWKALPEFLRQYRAELESIRRIDYGRLQSSAVELLADDDVAERTAGQFSHILVDEYQDTTVAQAEMLAGLYRPHRNLTVAGDPYQSIYSFRGAELRNIADFPDRFPDKEGKPAQRIVLTTSFRVPQAILEAAVRVTAGGELPGAAGPVISAPGTGTVETYGFSQAAAEAEWIAAEAERIRLLEGIPYSRMAVLVRSKRHLLVELSRALERRRIDHDVPDTRLADHGAVRLILDVVIAATDEPIERDRAMQRILLGPLFRLNLGSYREMQRERIRSESSWADALGALEERAAPLAKLIENPRWATEMAAADGFWELWSALPQLENLVTEPARTGDRQAWSSFSQVLDRLRERDPLATLAQYLMLVESEEFEATPLLAFSGDRDRLTLTTLHQAKGLEWDVVFIAAAVEGVFPDLRPRDSLLSSRLLSPSQPQDLREYGLFRLQEEMRLAYTAMCRARTRVIWTATTAGVEEHQARPSRFIARVAGTSTADEALSSPQLSERMATALEVEAHLRRVVRDAEAAAPLRMAALHALSTDVRHGMRSPERFAGVLERGSDKGLVPRQPTLEG
ncbi:MAG: ATP-dependent helicase, partial [Acidimicrobiia bacterium]|nr:ATP-dependent helicase [Acidimicrobiia bacterium]